ncbi:hypothetical protein HYFRA_00000743 [Hymenoscyphus fraxineus]|uniref:phosphoadenylyl-sulfate reductase (thioredoxin) n=1 Tax=Hymenoscyphus fraxineus TaxID=746836 RepID=A0A9N9KU17_9HELO|nr:hypothetical protein HYFRA_00000743 [Hymenoscyphus fraxineus]
MGPHHTESSLESGYASGASSSGSLPSIVLAKPHLKFLNQTLNNLAPIDVLRWCKITFPNLYQTTAFGISGLVTLDMLSKIHSETPDLPTIDAIFLDTLYHFKETHALIEKTKARYPNVHLHVYKPEGVETTAEFEARHGKELWKSNDKLYDWVAKVEPAQRAYSDLSVAAVLTGRRRSQGSKRESLDIIEIDEAGLIKINPLASWSFKQVQDYVKEHNVPYNELLDRGYKSVGDWHSTEPVKEGEDERAGRWKGQAKTECGIHNKRSKYAQFLFEMDQKRQQEELSAALKVVEVQPSPPASPENTENQTEAAAKLEKVDPMEPLSGKKSEAMEGVELTPPSTPPVESMDGVEASVSEKDQLLEEQVPTLEEIPAPAPIEQIKVIEPAHVSFAGESKTSSESVVIPSENKTEAVAAPTTEQTQFDADLAAAKEKFEHPEQRVESVAVEA